MHRGSDVLCKFTWEMQSMVFYLIYYKYFFLVPFRDSVLTKLLKNALGGNSKTFMVRMSSYSISLIYKLKGFLFGEEWLPGWLVSSWSHVQCFKEIVNLTQVYMMLELLVPSLRYWTNYVLNSNSNSYKILI